MVLVSVVMAAYNHANYIAEAIESVLNQTLTEFEFIIVDDCSTDDTLSIIRKYHDLDDRIKIIRNVRNNGAAQSRNKAIQHSNGNYIAIIDADDICMPERLKIQYNFLERNEEYYLVGSAVIRIDKQGDEVDHFYPPTDSDEIHKMLMRDNCIYHPSVMFRNTKEVSYRLKFETIEDYDFYLNLLSKGKKLINLTDLLIKYRLRESYDTSSRLQKQLILARKAQEYYHQRAQYGKDSYDELDLKSLLGDLISE